MSHYPQASFLTSANAPGQFVADNGAEVAFAGRSNAGKSSAINTLVNRRNFARTSKSPGRTQLINFFRLRDEERLVDLPGYGFARVSRAMQQHWQALLEAYFSSRKSLCGLFLIVDIRRAPGDFDWQMLEWAQSIGCPAHMLLTKADKLSQAAAAGALEQTRRQLAGRATVQIFSATKGTGAEDARIALQDFFVARK